MRKQQISREHKKMKTTQTDYGRMLDKMSQEELTAWLIVKEFLRKNFYYTSTATASLISDLEVSLIKTERETV